LSTHTIITAVKRQQSCVVNTRIVCSVYTLHDYILTAMDIAIKKLTN